MSTKSQAEILFATHLKEAGFHFDRQYKFCPERKWRADFCLHFPYGPNPILVEIHGAVYQHGHHTRGKGFEDDREKANTAQALGFRIFEFSTHQVEKGIAIAFLKEWLKP